MPQSVPMVRPAAHYGRSVEALRYVQIVSKSVTGVVTRAGSSRPRNASVCRCSLSILRLSRFSFHATSPFDFFSAMYFFKARRLFCLLRLCRFFRASSFMLILLVRRDKRSGLFADGSSALPTSAGLESCAAVGAMTAVAGFYSCVY
jgi:hypothetical protein